MLGLGPWALDDSTPVMSATLDSMIVLATRQAYFSSFSCATGSPLFIDRPARGDPIEKGVEGLDLTVTANAVTLSE
jgi:hypothetical protein